MIKIIFSYTGMFLTVGDDKIYPSTAASKPWRCHWYSLEIILNIKSAYFHIKNKDHIKSCLSDEDAAIFIHGFITNKILYGIHASLINRLHNLFHALKVQSFATLNLWDYNKKIKSRWQLMYSSTASRNGCRRSYFK